MTIDKLACLAALLAAISSPSHARKARHIVPEKQAPMPEDSRKLLQDTLPPQPARILGCAGPFAGNSSQDRLAAEFGARNVVFKSIEGPDGSADKATVVFDDDPTRRIVVRWRDVETRTRPSSISIGAPSTWTGPGGIHNGLPLREVEHLNGRAFKLHGFAGPNAGLVTTFGGKLGEIEGGCTLTARFEASIANPLPAKFAAISTADEIVSSGALLRRARPQVSEWTVHYR